MRSGVRIPQGARLRIEINGGFRGPGPFFIGVSELGHGPLLQKRRESSASTAHGVPGRINCRFPRKHLANLTTHGSTNANSLQSCLEPGTLHPVHSGVHQFRGCKTQESATLRAIYRWRDDTSVETTRKLALGRGERAVRSANARAYSGRQNGKFHDNGH